MKVKNTLLHAYWITVCNGLLHSVNLLWPISLIN
jgi:hypothetical protein